MKYQLVVAGLGFWVGVLGYWLGCFIGAARQRALWQDHMEKCNRYVHAVDDLDRWCGHGSPHARLIARHLNAIGEGKLLNSGTPCEDEACNISGLREQLRRLDSDSSAQLKA